MDGPKCVPPNACRSPILVPPNATLLGNKVLADEVSKDEVMLVPNAMQWMSLQEQRRGREGPVVEKTPCGDTGRECSNVPTSPGGPRTRAMPDTEEAGRTLRWGLWRECSLHTP